MVVNLVLEPCKALRVGSRLALKDDRAVEFAKNDGKSLK
jgi:hypothetical protein